MSLKHPVLALIVAAALPLIAADPGTTYPPTNPGPARPMIGITMSPVPLDIQQQEGLEPHQGILIIGINTNSAAANMGLQTGDILLGVNGATITSMGDVRTEVMSNQPGDPVNVIIQRQGEQMSASGTFSQWPSSIPFLPIDPSWENRVGASDQNVLNQLVRDTGNLHQAAQDVAEQLGMNLDGTRAASTSSSGRGAGEQGDLGAWHFAYALDSRNVHAEPAQVSSAMAITANGQDALLLPAIDTPSPWYFTWRMSTPACSTIP